MSKGMDIGGFQFCESRVFKDESREVAGLLRAH